MYDPSTSPIESEQPVKEHCSEKSLKKARETVHEGGRAVEELTSAITQLAYEEDRRRQKFTEVLAMIKGILDSIQNKCITVHWRHKDDDVLISNLRKLSKGLLELADLVASPNIEEMKGIIEDLANW